MTPTITIGDIEIPPLGLPGQLSLPAYAKGLIIFAHGSGSSRLSPRNTYVASALNRAGLGTLLFDLLHPHEATDRENVFDIPLLAGRLEDAIDWSGSDKSIAALPIGLFGASTGAAAALMAAAKKASVVASVVSRGGRPDLAAPALSHVKAPTLLIIGECDDVVIALNRQAKEQLVSCPVELEIVKGATHLFEEPGALDCVIDLARVWFLRTLREADVS